MTDTKHIVNVLTFSHPKKELTFGFKLQKEKGHSPLRKGEFPKELWKKHEKELSNTQRLYCDFSSTENSKYITQVDLTKSIYFAKHYYHFRIAEYFKQVAHVVHPNFVNSATIWLESPKESTTEYKLYYKFTLAVRLAMISDEPELVVSYDGTSKVLKKSVQQIIAEDIDTDLVKWMLINGELVKNDENYLPEDFNNHLDEYFPVLNFDLANALEFPAMVKMNKDKYANYYKNIDGFLNKYLNTEEFKEIIPHTGNWHDLESVSTTSEGTNLLKFGQGTHTDPYEGLKAFKPCKPVPPGRYRFFFICHEKDTKIANIFHEYSKRKKGYIDFNKFLSLPLVYDEKLHITFSDDNPLEEIKSKLSEADLIPNTNYLAVYINPSYNFKATNDNINFYYKIKQLLLQYKVSTQVILRENITKDSFQHSIRNIAIATLAKLGGIPWRLDREINNELIVGIGAFKSKKYNNRYIGSTFCFANDGKFKGFNVLPAGNHILLAGAIREAVEAYKKQHEKTERLIIHFYKRMNNEEIAPIIRQLKSIDKNIPIVIITVNKTASSDIVVFDKDYDRKMPYSGTYIPIGMDSYILCNNTRYKATLNGEHTEEEREAEKAQLEKQLKSFPLPVKLHLQSTDRDIINDPIEVKKLIDQVYQFSRMYWKSVSQQNLPVTTKYPEMVAEIYPHFEGGKLYEFGKKNLWFL